MAPREKEFSAVVVVVDTGSTSHSSGFLARSAVPCVQQLLERKLFCDSPDRFGVVLCGSEKTSNPLNYKNVTLVDRDLTVADWQLLEFVNKHVQGTYQEADWLDAVVVALHFLKESTEGSKKCTNKKIVLVSDLGCPASQDKLDIIVKNMQREGVEFNFFGPEWCDQDDDSVGPDAQGGAGNNGNEEENGENRETKPKTACQTASERMIAQLVDATDGVMCDIEVAILNLQKRERRAKKPMGWKVELEIGSRIRINTVGYIQVRREAPKSWKRCLAKGDDGSELKADVAFVKNNENQEVIEPDQVIESYKYGAELITVSDDIKANHKYESGPKSLLVVGFSPLDNLQREILVGDGCMVFQPPEGDEPSCSALSALTYALHDSNYVALVRKVYRANSCPRMGVLVPEMKPDEDGNLHMSLVYIELPYMEDRREYDFAPMFTKTTKPSKEQLEVADEFIDALMLDNGEDGLLETDQVLNPYYQHMYQCLSHRAMKPGQILPEVDPEIKSLMGQPEEVKAKADEILKKIEEVFPREEVQVKKEKVTADKMFGKKRSSEEEDEDESKKVKSDDLSLNARSVIAEVGSTTPVQDFQQLIDEGQPLISVGQQLENVILKLLQTSFGKQMYDKICSCLGAYRETCLRKANPSLYNDYLREMKYALESTNKTDLMVEVAEKHLGLITKDEHYDSKVEDKEAKQFLVQETVEETKGNQDNGEQKEEEEDLLDDL